MKVVNTLLTFALVLTCSLASGQTPINDVLKSIEQNNSTLKAAREMLNAQKLDNQTGLTPANPEIEGGYLWGSPSATGNRTDISVKQSFDFPTAYGIRSSIANRKDELADIQYSDQRMIILLEAKLIAIELIYYNAYGKEMEIRLQHATTLAEAYKDRLNKGDANKLEFNKAMLNLSTVKGEIARINVERESRLKELRRLNGGSELLFNESSYTPSNLPLNFDEWYGLAEGKIPQLLFAMKEAEISKSQINLTKAMALPKFTAGYMSEKVVGQQFNGITVGMSIPLWENRNRVKQAKAAARASESRLYDTQSQISGMLRNSHARAIGLMQAAADYSKSLETLNNTILLKKALEAGEISLLDYIVEIGLYYNTVNQMLEAKRDSEIAVAQLTAFDL